MTQAAKRELKKTMIGLCFALPVIVGLVGFTLLPMISSLIYSFCDYDVLTPMEFVGFENYIRMFRKEPYGYWDNGFANSMSVTFLYALVSVPLSLVLSYLLAVFANRKLPGMPVYRVLYYIPTIMPGVVGGLLWSDILDIDFGFINIMLRRMGLEGFTFLSSESTALPTFIGMSLFSLGGSIVLWTAQLKNIPESLYEACSLETDSAMQKFLHITIPYSTPMIFYSLIMGIIGSLQVFSSAMMLSGVAPGSLDFYVSFIYNVAFVRQEFGMACALSWVLFIIIGVITFLLFKKSGWVQYGGDF